MKALVQAYRYALAAGGDDAQADYPAVAVLDFVDAAEQAADLQRGFVQDLFRDMHDASPAQLAVRLDTFGDTVTRAYNRGYGQTVTAAHPDYRIVWHLGDAEHCPLCVARDGKEFTLESLPGWPGDGGFGGPVCEGGPKCACWLSFESPGVTAIANNPQRDWALAHYAEQNRIIAERRAEAQQAMDAVLDALPEPAQYRARSRQALRRELARLANERIRSSSGYQGVTVEPQDIPAQVIADLLGAGTQRGVEDITLEQMREAIERMFTKSAKTPYYSATHHPLGTEGLWHYQGLQLPAYIQNVAKGIMESGHSRSEAIPMAINAIKRWASGGGDVHPEVRRAAAKALVEWDELKATHHKSKE